MDWMGAFTAPKWGQAWTGTPSPDTMMNLFGLMSNPKMMQAMMECMALSELLLFSLYNRSQSIGKRRNAIINVYISSLHVLVDIF